jgi:hypothetical protein
MCDEIIWSTRQLYPLNTQLSLPHKLELSGIKMLPSCCCSVYALPKMMSRYFSSKQDDNNSVTYLLKPRTVIPPQQHSNNTWPDVPMQSLPRSHSNMYACNNKGTAGSNVFCCVCPEATSQGLTWQASQSRTSLESAVSSCKTVSHPWQSSPYSCCVAMLGNQL